MKPRVPSAGRLEIVPIIFISHTLRMHCDGNGDWMETEIRLDTTDIAKVPC